MSNNTEIMIRTIINQQAADGKLLAEAVHRVNQLSQVLAQYGQMSQNSFQSVAKDINRMDERIREIAEHVSLPDSPVENTENKEQ